MHTKIIRNISLKLFTTIIIGSFFLYSLALPSINYKIGNIFFGEIPKLYNIALAQFFFKNAADPLLGKPFPYANHQLSRTYFIQGKLEKSLLFANKEIEIYPNHISTNYIIGLTFGYMNREKEAIEAFGKYIDYNSKHPKVWAARNDSAWLQFRTGDIDGALKTMEPIASSTNNPWVQNTYGTLLMNKKRYREAKIAFTNAQKAASVMTEKSWGEAYPGNDPRVYGTGLQAMRKSIQTNLSLLELKL